MKETSISLWFLVYVGPLFMDPLSILHTRFNEDVLLAYYLMNVEYIVRDTWEGYWTVGIGIVTQCDSYFVDRGPRKKKNVPLPAAR